MKNYKTKKTLNQGDAEDQTALEENDNKPLMIFKIKNK